MCVSRIVHFFLKFPRWIYVSRRTETKAYLVSSERQRYSLNATLRASQSTCKLSSRAYIYIYHIYMYKSCVCWKLESSRGCIKQSNLLHWHRDERIYWRPIESKCKPIYLLPFRQEDEINSRAVSLHFLLFPSWYSSQLNLDTLSSIHAVVELGFRHISGYKGLKTTNN